jgi:hypothetical protein
VGVANRQLLRLSGGREVVGGVTHANGALAYWHDGTQHPSIYTGQPVRVIGLVIAHHSHHLEVVRGPEADRAGAHARLCAWQTDRSRRHIQRVVAHAQHQGSCAVLHACTMGCAQAALARTGNDAASESTQVR